MLKGLLEPLLGHSPYWRDLAVILKPVEQAAKLCEQIRQDPAYGVMSKSDASPVTVADVCSQLLIVDAIWRDDPQAVIVAEEDCESVGPQIEQQVNKHLPSLDWKHLLTRRPIPSGCRRFWTIDPVDGTKGFVRGDQYAVCVALVEDEEVRLGVLGCPRLLQQGCFYVAIAGAGCFEVSGDQVRALKVERVCLKGAILCESFVPSHSSHAESARLIEKFDLYPNPTRMDSQCKYGLVAAGRANIYYRRTLRKDYQENIWDHAAGFLVVCEAGGIVTDMAGQIPRFRPQSNLIRHQGLIASNLHAQDHAKLIQELTKM